MATPENENQVVVESDLTKTSSVQNDKTNKQEKVKENKKQKSKKDKKPREHKPGKVKETMSELKKVSWPSFGKVVKQTLVVLGVTIFFTLVLFAIDQLLGLGYNQIVDLFKNAG